jgi:hypothetical protein
LSIIYIAYLYYNHHVINTTTISKLTDKWCKEVVVNHDPVAIYQLFCKDGNLVGTVSQKKRKGKDIKLYFDYFAKLPNIKIISKKYNISKVTSDVYINTAFIKWLWDGIDEPITARMTFVFKGKCIFQLHSSALPDVNTSLVNISGNL